MLVLSCLWFWDLVGFWTVALERSLDGTCRPGPIVFEEEVWAGIHELVPASQNWLVDQIWEERAGFETHSEHETEVVSVWVLVGSLVKMFQVEPPQLLDLWWTEGTKQM